MALKTGHTQARVTEEDYVVSPDAASGYGGTGYRLLGRQQ
jgi:hypothetical protein